MSVSAVRAGEAYVEIAVKDTTAAGVNSALKNYGRLQSAAENAQRASSRLQQTSQLGMVLQPRNGRLVQTSQSGLVLPARASANPYSLSPDIDMQRAAARAQKTFGAKEVGYFPPVMNRGAKEFAASMESSAKQFTGIDIVAAKLLSKFLGIGVAVGTANAAFNSIADAIEKKIKNPAISFADAMSQGFSDAFDSLPILGQIARIGRALVIDLGMGRADEERQAEQASSRNRYLATQQERNKRFGEGLKTAATQGQEQSLADAIAAAQQSVSGEVFSQDQLAQKVASARKATDQAFAILAEQEAKAIADATTSIRDEAGEAGLIGQFQGVDASNRAIYRDDPRVQQRIDAETAVIRRQFEQRREGIAGEVEQRSVALGAGLQRRDETAEEAAKKAAAEAAKALADATQERESLLLSQQDRLRLADLDAEDLSLSGKEDPKSVKRREEIKAERELIALQQSLDERELQILALDRLSLEDRQSLIEQERAIAEREADNIKTGISARIAEANARVRGTDGRPTLVASGTFSAFSASRRVADNSDLAREANKYLQQIVQNTGQTGVTFAP